jgi:hypothetical protein
LAARAHILSEKLEAAMPDEHFYVCSDVGYAGGGSMPGAQLETVVVKWRPSSGSGGVVPGGILSRGAGSGGPAPSAQAVASALRHAAVPVIARVRDDEICFDLRTIHEDEVDWLVASASTALSELTSDDAQNGPSSAIS